MSKKVLSLVLALVMVLGTFGTAFAAATTPTGNEKVDKLIELGLVKGYADGTYGLAQAITRAEMATMVVRALDLEAVANASAAFPSQFTDMNSANVLWARGFVNVAAGQGIVNGYPNGTFVPANNVTYAEAAAMLVRVLGGLTAAEQANAVWPTTYLAKAAQLGVFADVDGIVDYNAPATRENLFEMVFNTLMNGSNLLIANTVEGIVVENYRTESLAKDEVVVHVMKDQDARDDKYDFEEGEEFKVVVTPELAEKGVDVETLLGKVVKVSYDKAGKVVGIEQLAGYTYLTGTIDSITAKKIELNEKDYTVSKSESRDAADERLYQVYLNNDDVEYDELFERTTLNAEYANITVRNGKVLFIDAYKFDDVAPVAKDIDAKDKVAYYDDNRDGEVRSLTVDEDSYVLNFIDGVLSVGNYKEIAANDVIHWYGDTFIVRPAEDNMVEGVYKEANAARLRDAADVNIVVDGEEYPALLENEKRDPVYSLTASSFEFARLTDSYDAELADFEKEEVVLLLDMFGNVQSISSEVIDGRFYAMISDTYNYDFELVKTDNSKVWYDSDRATKFEGVVGTTREQRLAQFQKNDLVQATASEELLTKVTKVVTSSVYTVNDITKTFVKFAGTNDLYFGRNSVVYVEGKGTAAPKAMTVADFLKNYDVLDADGNYKPAVGLQGYVVTNEKDGKLVDIIVFTNATLKKASTTTLVAEVTRVRTGTDYYLTLKQADGTSSTHLVEDIATVGVVDAVYQLITDPIITAGDIVKVNLTKDEDPVITDIEELIDELAQTYTVTDKGTGWVKLDGVEYRFAADAHIFADFYKGDLVSIHTVTPSSIVIDAIDVRKAAVVTPTYETLQAVYKLTTSELMVRVNNIDYKYGGSQTQTQLEALLGRQVKLTTVSVGTPAETIVTAVTPK